MFRGKWKWALVVIGLLLAAGSGLIVGKMREGDFIAQMYERKDFILLDDNGDFFHLKKVPQDRKVLLIFTPDLLRVDFALPFAEFAKFLPELKEKGVDPLLITRISKDIVANFKRSTRFSGRILLDPSGTVGKLTGAWPGSEAVRDWGYVLLDNQFKVHWAARSAKPLQYTELVKAWESVATPSKPTSSASP